MGLLDGDLAAVFHAVFSGLFLDGTLHAGTGEPVYNEYGDIIGYSGGDTAVKVQTDATSEGVKASAGYAAGDVRLIVLAQGIPTITTDHEVTDGHGDRYRVHDVEQDAARSHYVCRGRPI
jgi:hypothetical protein